MRYSGDMRRLALASGLLIVSCFEDPSGGPSTSTTGTTSGGETTAEATSSGTTGASSTSTPGSTSMSSTGIGPGDSTGAGCNVVLVEEAELVADTMLVDGSCDGANHFGAFEYLNIGLGTGLFRFRLSAESRARIESEELLGFELVLSRDFECVEDGCPAEAGMFEARPLRNDWAEGVADEEYSGADWCRRLGTESMPQPWGADGAQLPGVDIGEASGTAVFDTQQPMVSIELDPGRHGSAPWITPEGTGALLSVHVVASSGVFVAASRENVDPAEETPRLQIRYCET